MTKPELVFLGTSCGIPTVERNLPSVAMRYNGKVYLFDCGEGTQRQMMRYVVSFYKVEAIFISHLHLDHYLGIFGLLDTLRLMERKEPLTVVCPPGMFDGLEKRYSFLTVKELKKDGEVADFGDFKVDAFHNKHNIKESFGFAIRFKDKQRFYGDKARKLGIKGPMFTKLEEAGKITIGKKTIKLSDVSYTEKGKLFVYSGDTRPCDGVKKAASGADILIHDSTFSSEEQAEAEEKSHSTAAEAAKLARSAKVKELVLTHISQRYKNSKELEEEAKKEIKNVVCAYDGFRITP